MFDILIEELHNSYDTITTNIINYYNILYFLYYSRQYLEINNINKMRYQCSLRSS